MYYNVPEECCNFLRILIRWHNLTFFYVIRKQKKGNKKSRCLLAQRFLWRQKGPLSPLEERWDILHHHGVKLFRPIEKDEKRLACTALLLLRRARRPNNSQQQWSRETHTCKKLPLFNVSTAEPYIVSKKRAYLAAFISLWGFSAFSFCFKSKKNGDK